MSANVALTEVGYLSCDSRQYGMLWNNIRSKTSVFRLGGATSNNILDQINNETETFLTTMQYQIELYHALMQYGSNRLHIWLLFIRFLDHL